MLSRSPSLSVEGFRVLTARETQLILLGSEGLSDKEIARELRISTGTVVTLWSKVRTRLNINSRIAAISVMVKAVTRLTMQLGAADQNASEAGDVRMLITSHQVVLAANPQAYRAFAVDAGDSLVRKDRAQLEFLDDRGRPISLRNLPWEQAFSSGRTVQDILVTARTQAGEKDFVVSVRLHQDPILNTVAFLTFTPRPALAVVSSSSRAVAAV